MSNAHRKPIQCQDTGECVTSYAAYLKTRHWHRLRLKYFESFGCKCYHCDTRKPPIQLHHLTYVRLGNEDLGDLISLCRKCHMREEDKLKLERATGGKHPARLRRRLKKAQDGVRASGKRLSALKHNKGSTERQLRRAAKKLGKSKSAEWDARDRSRFTQTSP